MNTPALDVSPDSLRRELAPLYADRVLPSGEPLMEHAQALAQLAGALQPDERLVAAAWLFAVPEVLRDAQHWLEARYGVDIARLVLGLQQLTRVSERTRGVQAAADQSERLRKMVLAMAGDLRMVFLRLASRLQTLRWFAKSKRGQPQPFAKEALDLYAPLANRLGVWQIKWELEDLAFRFLHPEPYKAIATQLDAKRGQREQFIERTVQALTRLLEAAGIQAQVSGRPKHIYSIWTKMQQKHLDFSQLYDVRALRVIVADVASCYEALSVVHAHYSPVPSEFDDYIAKPKPNGYQSLHTVVNDAQGHSLEIQIRSQAMHEYAELGFAAHWHYKESGGSQQAAEQAERVAWLRRLLLWREEMQEAGHGQDATRIYVLTPQGKVVELPQGATPVDFAYYLHTDLGHRCRGARVDGAMVALNTPLKTGQTVQITAAKTGGPSRDWLNTELGYLVSPRARAKVRHWFNQMAIEQTITQGRTILDRELARLGRTAIKLDDLARRLGFASVNDLCVAVAKEELSLRSIEQILRSDVRAHEASAELTPTALRSALPLGSAALSDRPQNAKGQVLVLGVDALLTSLARCCRPVPPDPIVGFITRGKGVSVHRLGCRNAAALKQRHPERLIEVAWAEPMGQLYPVDIVVFATQRAALLHDVLEAFAREKINVRGFGSQPQRGLMMMQFTVEIENTHRLNHVLASIRELNGVVSAIRK
ncbi:MAG TPA: bifunctional (p)ppGpp synthetase/guanosine-3',5'-bis(diphosphate) 3'-pyrophosphohydrolase [Burkholderiaceae bacterium]|nr:bifunctional (p)ppGpp synthetase/guanosine-3',5'-bis(diphosphate) 3'-pyrophosphohydrolase [Burkholderiaceae bacterium]